VILRSGLQLGGRISANTESLIDFMGDLIV